MGEHNSPDGRKPFSNFDLGRGGTAGQSGPFKAEVMSTVDPTYSGRIRVWIKTFGDENNKDKESSWFTVRYLSPFYGVTPHLTLDAAAPDFENNGHAYGMWMQAPDIGSEVLVIFAEADPNQGYYIGCIPTPQMNHMVPAIGAQENPHYNNIAQEEKCAHASRVPVTEMDKNSATMENSEFTKVSKPVHSVLAGQMWKQGIIVDPMRGPISSSAQRESPSRVYGISTPGRPVYSTGMFDHDAKEKAVAGQATDTSISGRRGGHSFVMDDGEINGDNNLIRFRTSTGHQITMSDDGASIFIIHANGNTWWELGAEGTIDMYAANSINIRTGGDLNFHADKNININALEDINMYAKKNINIEAEENLNLTGKKQLVTYSKTKLEIKSDGTIAVDAGSSASYKSAGHTEIKGSTIGLNDGSAESVTAPVALPQVNFPDSVMDDIKGWSVVDSKFKSIVTRAPTHEPYDAHGLGVKDVKPFESK